MQAKIGFINLGCAKNLVDAERIITQLQTEGYEIVTTYNEADLVIINTCGFINEAIAESLETIADAIDNHGKVIVTGCCFNDLADILIADLLIQKQAEHGGLERIVAADISCFNLMDQCQILIPVRCGLVNLINEFTQNVQGDQGIFTVQVLAGPGSFLNGFSGDSFRRIGM